MAGAKLTIKIDATKSDFTSKQEIIPTTSSKQAVTDSSVIPTNNTLLSQKTMHVYSFPLDTSASVSAWVYNAEALLKNGGKTLDLTLYCVDYSSATGSLTCQKLLRDILPTIQHYRNVKRSHG